MAKDDELKKERDLRNQHIDEDAARSTKKKTKKKEYQETASRQTDNVLNTLSNISVAPSQNNVTDRVKFKKDGANMVRAEIRSERGTVRSAKIRTEREVVGRAEVRAEREVVGRAEVRTERGTVRSATIKKENGESVRLVVANQKGAYKNKLKVDTEPIQEVAKRSIEEPYQSSEILRGAKRVQGYIDKSGITNARVNAAKSKLRGNLTKDHPNKRTVEKIEKLSNSSYRVIRNTKDYRRNMHCLDKALAETGLGGGNAYTQANVKRMLKDGYVKHKGVKMELSHDQKLLLKEKSRLLKEMDNVKFIERTQGRARSSNILTRGAKVIYENSDVGKGVERAKSIVKTGQNVYKATKVASGAAVIGAANVGRVAAKTGVKGAELANRAGAQFQKLSIGNDKDKLEKWKVTQKRSKENFKQIQSGISNTANKITKKTAIVTRNSSLQNAKVVVKAGVSKAGDTKLGKKAKAKVNNVKNSKAGRKVRSAVNKGKKLNEKKLQFGDKIANSKFMKVLRAPMNVVNTVSILKKKLLLFGAGFLLILVAVDIIGFAAINLLSNPFGGFINPNTGEEDAVYAMQQCVDRVYKYQNGMLNYLDSGENPEDLEMPEELVESREKVESYEVMFKIWAMALNRENDERERVLSSGDFTVDVDTEYCFTGPTKYGKSPSYETWQKNILAVLAASMQDTDNLTMSDLLWMSDEITRKMVANAHIVITRDPERIPRGVNMMAIGMYYGFGNYRLENGTTALLSPQQAREQVSILKRYAPQDKTFKIKSVIYIDTSIEAVKTAVVSSVFRFLKDAEAIEDVNDDGVIDAKDMDEDIIEDFMSEDSDVNDVVFRSDHYDICGSGAGSGAILSEKEITKYLKKITKRNKKLFGQEQLSQKQTNVIVSALSMVGRMRYVYATSPYDNVKSGGKRMSDFWESHMVELSGNGNNELDEELNIQKVIDHVENRLSRIPNGATSDCSAFVSTALWFAGDSGKWSMVEDRKSTAADFARSLASTEWHGDFANLHPGSVIIKNNVAGTATSSTNHVIIYCGELKKGKPLIVECTTYAGRSGPQIASSSRCAYISRTYGYCIDNE